MSENDVNKKKQEDTRLKIIMRRLPPLLTEDEFREFIKEFSENIRQFWFCPADQELYPFSFSRAYLVFEDENDAFPFCDLFNGKPIKDSNGNHSYVIVERAPNQGVPPSFERGTDRRVDTMKDDYEYKKFLDEYNQFNTRKLVDFEALVKELEEKRKHFSEGIIKETPLLEFLVSEEIKKAPPKGGSRRMAASREMLENFYSSNLQLEKVKENDKGKSRNRDRRSKKEKGEKEKDGRTKKTENRKEKSSLNDASSSKQKERKTTPTAINKENSNSIEQPQTSRQRKTNKPNDNSLRSKATTNRQGLSKPKESELNNNAVQDRPKTSSEILSSNSNGEKQSSAGKISAPTSSKGSTGAVSNEAGAVSNERFGNKEKESKGDERKGRRNKDRPEKEIYQPRRARGGNATNNA